MEALQGTGPHIVPSAFRAGHAMQGDAAGCKGPPWKPLPMLVPATSTFSPTLNSSAMSSFCPGVYEVTTSFWGSCGRKGGQGGVMAVGGGRAWRWCLEGFASGSVQQRQWQWQQQQCARVSARARTHACVRMCMRTCVRPYPSAHTSPRLVRAAPPHTLNSRRWRMGGQPAFFKWPSSGFFTLRSGTTL